MAPPDQERPKTLGDALLAEIARVRDEVMLAYIEIAVARARAQQLVDAVLSHSIERSRTGMLASALEIVVNQCEALERELQRLERELAEMSDV